MALDGYISGVGDGSGEVVRAVALQRVMPRPGSPRLATGLGPGLPGRGVAYVTIRPEPLRRNCHQRRKNNHQE